MINNTWNQHRHWLPAMLTMVAITASMPSRVEAIGAATPEFLRGETRPNSVAVLPPLGPNQTFARFAGQYVEELLKEKGYKTETLTPDQINADPELQALVSRANKRYNVERGVLKGDSLEGGALITVVWKTFTSPLDVKKVRQRQLRVGESANALATKLQVDGLVFPRFEFRRSGNFTTFLLDVSVVNGTNGDLEAYFLGYVPFWSSPSEATQQGVKEIRGDFPAVGEVTKTKHAKGSTLGTPPVSLHVAARWGDLDQVGQFLSKGADINARDEGEGNTPLHWATVAGNNAIAELLIAKGAEVDAKNDNGNTPLSLATVTDDEPIAQLLIAKGADVNTKNNKRTTPLILAAFTGHKDVAQLLIAKGAKVDAKNKKGITPLSAAAATGHRDVAALLIAKGADVNVEDKLYNTPLHWAAATGRWEVAELLIAKGAEVNAKNIDDMTPLSLATSRHHKDFAERLKQHGGKQ